MKLTLIIENIIKFPTKQNQPTKSLSNNSLVGDVVNDETAKFYCNKIETTFLPIVYNASKIISSKFNGKNLQYISRNFNQLSHLQKQYIQKILSPFFVKSEQEWNIIKQSFNEFVFNDPSDDGDVFDVTIASSLTDEVDAFWHLKNLLN